MSGKSSNSRQLIAAGIVGVGIGVLAAGVGYTLATRSPTSNISQPSERRVHPIENRKVTTENVTRHGNDQCKICGKAMSSEPSVSLSCNHSFHRKCLFSSYVVQVQVNKGTMFHCPFKDCKFEISEEIVESLIVPH